MHWEAPPPIDKTSEKGRLERIANGLRTRTDIPCELDSPDQRFFELLTDDSRQAFERDIGTIDRDRLRINFPWDSSGKVALDTAVLLRVYSTHKAPGKDRIVCLAACGPQRRRDAQAIHVKLLDVIYLNQSHRWEKHPYLWQNVSPPFAESERVHDRSLQLLDEGKIVEASLCHGIQISTDVHRLLGGQDIGSPTCCAHPDSAWTALLIETFRESAPWLLAKAVSDDIERQNVWVAGKKGRRRSPPELKLAIFPGQHHSRKASLMLTGNLDGTQPRFEIGVTGSNTRLHDTAWKRPLVVDFARCGIPSPEGFYS